MTNYFDRNPKTFRLVFVLVAVVPLLAACLNVYHYLNRGIDDTIFSDSQSQLYIHRNLAAKAINTPAKFLGDDLYYGLQVGDLLLAINGTEVTSREQVEAIMRRLQPRDLVRFTIQRPTQRRQFLEFQANRRFLPVDFVREIPPTVYIYDVPSGGAADRAGLQVGDLVFRIDGRLFDGARAADFLVRRSLAGQKVTYDIIRNNQEITVDVTMARVQISLLVFLFQLCGLLWIGVGLFIGLARPQLAAGRLLGLGFFFLGISFTLMVNRGYLEGYWQRVLLVLFTFPSHFFGLATLYYSSLYFPSPISRLLSKKWIPLGYYSIAFAATIVSIFDSLRLYFVWILFLVGYHFFIEIRYRRLISAKYREREKTIRWCTFTGMAAILVWAIFRELLPSLWRVLLPCFTAGIILAGYLITIARYRLLGFQVRRSIQYALVSTSWHLVLLALFVTSLWFVSLSNLELPNLRLTSSTIEIAATPMSAERQESLEKFVVMILGLLIAFIFLSLSRRGIAWLRQQFHRSPYDFHRVTHELNDLMTQRLPLDALAKGMVTKLAELMFLKQVGVLFYRRGEIVAFQEAFPSSQKTNLFRSDEGQTLCDAMKQYRSELCVDYLESHLKAPLAGLGYRYIYPIHSKETFVGLLMVGEKLSEITFRHDDFAFLSTTTSQASIAIENGFLYEVVTQQERFKQELDIARRIQLTSLPQTTPEIPGLSVAGTSLPALEVGGDFYDYYIDGNTKLTVVVGDVSGKGTSAALYMSKLQGIFRTLLQDSLSPLLLFKKANPLVYRELDSASFITALGARFDMATQEVAFSRAGHLPLAYLSASSPKATYLNTKGVALGLECGDLLARIQEERTATFAKGDLFVMVSDGLTEAFNMEGQAYGEERLLEMLEICRDQNPDVIMNRILEDVRLFCGACEQHDDQTLVVIRIDPDPREEPNPPAATAAG